MQELLRTAARQWNSDSEQDTRRVDSVKTTPSGLQGPSLSFAFKPFCLHLRRFREYDFLQGINEATTNHERSTAKRLRRLPFDLLHQRSSKMRNPTDMGTERDSPSFCFSRTTFYSQIDYSRVDKGLEERTHRLTERQFVGRGIIEQLVKGDAVPGLDVVQRHGEASFYLGDITDEQDVLDILKRSGDIYIVQNTSLWQGVKDPSVYARANVEVTRTIIDAAIAAGVRRLIYTSSAGVVFISTDVVEVDERVPFLEELFDAYNDAQEMFKSRDNRISDNNNLFDYTYVRTNLVSKEKYKRLRDMMGALRGGRLNEEHAPRIRGNASSRTEPKNLFSSFILVRLCL
ncbi:hypothetical protein M404DRAFT_19859 [Pisolithus tinctorius Marx 270]|uniref:3-beta hydroxysteroid dehydrogenase/isomerase domain-containing protein n=1 Tax=Pisolithus tinctorius Marx 270 TaxID=870435 RepID=A0A0C3PSD1_PISTI|nr:hypothetical protein M404DRAFT_19859 [Pisolithus tinctorius Marx 270]